MKLAIISHTEHYKTPDGTIKGWGPTVNEINHLLEIFDEIYHVAMFHNKPAPPSATAYSSKRVHFIPIPTSGGKGILSKVDILLKGPKTLYTIRKILKLVDVFQFRAPTGIGVYSIPYLIIFSKKKGWFKYAGNWNQINPPIGYGLQRYFLKKQNRLVTINGYWQDQPNHCLTFENPCLNLRDLEKGSSVAIQKRIDEPLTFCFVGRLESLKGVGVILEAFTKMPEIYHNRIKVLHFVGDGPEASKFKDQAKKIKIPIRFHGFLSRKETFHIYMQSQVFLLPSTASEGFPKVIAEAMNFGCLPIVSNVSSIGQYVNHKQHGYVLEKVSAETILRYIEEVFSLSQDAYQEKLRTQRTCVEKFTYSYYNTRIKRLLSK